MPFSAVLDANVLYPFSLRDTLLRLAELELYTPLWSDRILDEMRRNLVEHRLTDAQAASIEQAMRSAFEEAEVDTAEIERLEPAMTNEAKDRHVLAAAVASDSELIVTLNLDDFPPEACEPLGVEAVHPDDFLLDPGSSARRPRAAVRRPSPALAARPTPRRADHRRRPPLRRNHPQPELTSPRARFRQCVVMLRHHVGGRLEGRALGTGLGDRFRVLRVRSGRLKEPIRGGLESRG